MHGSRDGVDQGGLWTTPPTQGTRLLLQRTPTSPGKPARKPRPCFAFVFQVHIHPRPANPSQSGTWVGKVFGSGWPLSPRHPASIPQPPAPRPGGGGGAHRAKAAEAKGDFASHILLTFFLLNVKNLNACFECLIRLSSFCHLFCFVVHYIQLHISNPQILPRHQNTCQAFTFRSRRIKGLSRLAHIAEQRDALASPAAAMLRTWKPPPPPPSPRTGTRDGDAPSLARRRGGGSSSGIAGMESQRRNIPPSRAARSSAQHLSDGNHISQISRSESTHQSDISSAKTGRQMI